ncbi:MAG: M3 family oligoendopeptidase [Eubacterium sp.]|nr:M3 family oligoendopeptidase [Eubacterium sp.]MBR7072428.1 M3 family oligoendopeptidase [Eubacterium sp.]
MKFSEMKYARPDIETVKSELQAVTQRLVNAADYAEAKKAFIDKDRLERKFSTQNILAEIRHSIDTRDKFYDEEVDFWNEKYPEIEEYLQQWTEALLKSEYREEFIKDFGDIVFLNGELAVKSFSPEIISEMQKENDLVNEYNKLIASAQIDFNGGTYTISQLSPFKNDADDGIRLAAWKAEGKWYKDNQKELDRIYDGLVKLRDTMGKKLGYGGYTQLGYYRMMRNCYDKNDVEKFRNAVVKYLVPVADGIFRKQAERLGVSYPLSFADAALSFRSGNPKPQGTPDEILEAGRRFYDKLSPETSEFFNMMLDNELLDVLSTEGKQAGGYCTGIYEYDVPFIFANFNGTSSDVETVTHEAGHAFADWYNRDRVPMATIWPSMEGCEVHSMSMEFFAWMSAEDFFGSDTRKFLYSHLAGAIKFIPYGTMVDHFQHIVYEKPELTPAERHAEWKRLLGIYMPWLKLDGEIPFYSDGEGWQRQLHIYGSPFYYIDYCLAQTVALEFWALIQEDLESAWKKYIAYTEQGGSTVFTKLLENAGLESPFDEATLKGVCEKANDWLNAYNLEGIE